MLGNAASPLVRPPIKIGCSKRPCSNAVTSEARKTTGLSATCRLFTFLSFGSAGREGHEVFRHGGTHERGGQADPLLRASGEHTIHPCPERSFLCARRASTGDQPGRPASAPFVGQERKGDRHPLSLGWLAGAELRREPVP